MDLERIASDMREPDTDRRTPAVLPEPARYRVGEGVRQGPVEGLARSDFVVRPRRDRHRLRRREVARRHRVRGHGIWKAVISAARRVGGTLEQAGGGGLEVPEREVDQTLAEAFDTWHVWRVYADRLV